MSLSKALLAGALLALPVSASDHLDGQLTTAHRAGDLSDLYAFPTPGRSGSLTLILDTYPLAPAEARFYPEIGYTFRLRRAVPPEIDAAPRVETRDEVTIDCRLRSPGPPSRAVVICRSPRGLSVRSPLGGASESGDFRLWAGRRSDPFFLNVAFFSDLLEGKLDPPEDDDGMAGANVLALVLELDVARLWPDPPTLLAVAAQATERDARGLPFRRLDRLGRPEITNVGLAARDEPDVRDISNLDRPFEVAVERRDHYRERLERNIAFFDALDGTTDWDDRARGELAALLVDDYLLVDLDEPCTAGSFLEIESALLGRRPHRTCGGRRLGDDVMDALYTLFVSGRSGRIVRDGVDGPTTPLSPAFPYLAPPDTGLRSALRVYLARRVLGIPDLE